MPGWIRGRSAAGTAPESFPGEIRELTKGAPGEVQGTGQVDPGGQSGVNRPPGRMGPSPALRASVGVGNYHPRVEVPSDSLEPSRVLLSGHRSPTGERLWVWVPSRNLAGVDPVISCRR